MRNLYVRNQNGEMVPLNALIEVRQVQGTELITRYNLYPAASIFGAAAPGFSSGEALASWSRWPRRRCRQGMSLRLDLDELPGEAGRLPGLPHLRALHHPGLPGAGRALRELDVIPAAVILVVPMALVGVLLALMSRGYDNNLYTQVGLVLMIALASKNAILIVEFARDLHTGKACPSPRPPSKRPGADSGPS